MYMVGLAQVDSGTSSDSQVPTSGGDYADPIAGWVINRWSTVGVSSKKSTLW